MSDFETHPVGVADELKRLRQREKKLLETLVMARDALDEVSREGSRMDKGSALAVADICRARIINHNEQSE